MKRERRAPLAEAQPCLCEFIHCWNGIGTLLGGRSLPIGSIRIDPQSSVSIAVPSP